MKKQLVFVYTRINGIEKRMVNTNLVPKARVGMVENREFHEALGLKVGGEMRDLQISTSHHPIGPMNIEIRGSEATLYKLAKVIESASELDHGDCVSAQVGNAQINVTQGEEVKKCSRLAKC